MKKPNKSILGPRPPWSVQLEEARSLLNKVGPPFVTCVRHSAKTCSYSYMWKISPPSAVSNQASSLGDYLAHRRSLREFFSTPAMRKLPQEISAWVNDIRTRWIEVEEVSAEIDGCLQFLEDERKIRQTLLGSLDALKLISPELRAALRKDSKKAIKQLDRAEKKVLAAKQHLQPCKERFLLERSQSRTAEYVSLVNLLLSLGLSRNYAVQVAHDLQSLLRDSRSPLKPTSLRISSYREM